MYMYNVWSIISIPIPTSATCSSFQSNYVCT